MTNKERKARNIYRFVAVLLGVGGLAGIAVCLFLFGKLFSQSAGLAVFLLVVLGSVFTACTWTGFKLWSNEPRAKRWAKILLALQIPTFSIPGFVYEFYTGLSWSIYFDHGDNKFGTYFMLGSSANFELFNSSENLKIGVNLIAIALLVLIARLPRLPRLSKFRDLSLPIPLHSIHKTYHPLPDLRQSLPSLANLWN